MHYVKLIYTIVFFAPKAEESHRNLQNQCPYELTKRRKTSHFNNLTEAASKMDLKPDDTKHEIGTNPERQCRKVSNPEAALTWGAKALIPVARPLLPSAEMLLPYMQRIDQTRIYANQGPLVRALQDRLSARLGLASGTIAAGANATLALTISLSAMGVRPGKFCLMPAWTFAASAHAAIAAGLKPYLLDVDPKTWTFSPASVISAVERLGRGRVGAVMPVAPFGAPIDSRGWDAFYEQTRIPVVIDAAAGFDLLQPTLVPTVVSLHATKVLGAGEGGFVVSRDASVIAEVQRRANFGFWGAREASVVATNAKMSEYSAAVALASLDAWPETRARWITVAQAYRHALAACPGVTAMPGFGNFATTTCVVRLDPNLVDATRISLQLSDLGITTRRWWGRGLQAEPAFARAARDDLPVTEILGAETIGLPCSVDLGRGDITRICKALTHLLQPETQLLLRERA